MLLIARDCIKTEAAASSGGLDVLIDAEEVRRIVFLLDGRQALIIVAIACFDPCLAVVSIHEVDVGTTWIEFMDRIPIATPPTFQLPRPRRVGINGSNDH